MKFLENRRLRRLGRAFQPAICPHCGQTGHSFYVRANEAKDVTWHCSQCSGSWVTSTFAQFREAKEGQ